MSLLAMFAVLTASVTTVVAMNHANSKKKIGGLTKKELGEIIVKTQDEAIQMMEMTIFEGLSSYDLDSSHEERWTWEKEHITLSIKKDINMKQLAITGHVVLFEGLPLTFLRVTYDYERSTLTTMERSLDLFVETRFYDTYNQLINHYSTTILRLFTNQKVSSEALLYVQEHSIHRPKKETSSLPSKASLYAQIQRKTDHLGDATKQLIQDIIDHSSHIDSYEGELDSQSKHDYKTYVETDLVRLIDAFISLSESARKDRHTNFLASLEAIKSKLVSIIKSMDEQISLDFDITAKYIEKKNERNDPSKQDE